MSPSYPAISPLLARTLAACLFVLVATTASVADAQQDYLELAYADDLQTADALEEFQSLKNRVLTNRGAPPNWKADFIAGYQGYRLPQMTRVDSQANLAELRRDLYTDIRRSVGGVPGAHEELVKLCFEVSRLVVSENYHPAVRYNFMRLMGDLNEVEIDSGTPPLPWQPAMTEMLKAVGDPNQIDAVRVAALIGINRHVLTLQVGSSRARLDADREKITQTMLALLNSLDARPVDAGSLEGLAWMKRQAIEILGALGQVGENGEVYAAVMAAMSDRNEPLFLRCAAAGALAQLTYPPGFDAAAQEIYTQLGLLAFDCCNQELIRVIAWQEANMPSEDALPQRGRAPGRGTRPRDVSGNSEENYQAGSLRQALAMRSIIKEQLGKIEAALVNTERLAADADDRDLLSDVQSAVEDALKAVDQRDEDKNFHLEDFIDGLFDPTDELDALLGATATEEPEDPATLDDAPLGDDPLGDEPLDDDPLSDGLGDEDLSDDDLSLDPLADEPEPATDDF